MMDVLRRLLLLLLLSVWIGGLTLYAAVVVPIGTDIHGSVGQGVVTQQVTKWINVLATFALLAVLWDVARSRQRSRLVLWILMTACQIALFLIHPRLDALLDSTRRLVTNPAAFYQWHRGYLIATALQWGGGMAYLGVIAARDMRGFARGAGRESS